MCRIESKLFAAAGLFVDGAFNPPEFVVHVIQHAAALVGGLNQVAGLVVAVASAHCAADQGIEFAVVLQSAVGGGGLVFQTAHRVVVVAAGCI